MSILQICTDVGEEMGQQENAKEKVLFLSYVRREKWVMHDSLIAIGK
jgi:hypothetical protein